MQKYKIIKTLGDGSFGTVFKALNVQDNQLVAIKKMKQKYKNWDECTQLREIKSLRKLQHNNLIKLKEVLKINQELYLVFDFLEHNLYQVYNNLKEKGRYFTQNEIKTIIYQIASGLSHLHKNGFFHRDMKPQNILFDNNLIKICDFGLARQIRSRPPFTEYVSTRWYRAPQLLLRSTSYNSPVDIFALGCIMVELYTLNPLFPGNNEIDQITKILQVLGTPAKNDWPEGYKLASAMNYNFPQFKKKQLYDIIPDASIQAIQLIQQMLQYNSRKRPSASDIMRHPFFEKITIPNMIEEKKEIKFETLENKSIFVFPNQIKVQNPKEMEMRKSKIRFGNEIQKKHYNNNNNTIPNISQKFNEIQQILQELKEKKQKHSESKFPPIKIIKQQQQEQPNKFPQIMNQRNNSSKFPISLSNLKQNEKFRETPKFQSTKNQFISNRF